MVLESLITPFKAERKPWELFFYGILCTVVAMFLSFLVFTKHNGLIIMFLIVIGCTPLMYRTLKWEEKKDISYTKQTRVLQEHAKVILYLVYLFLGMVVAFTLMYVFLPLNMVMRVFDVQTNIMFFSGTLTGSTTQFTFFKSIFFNNIRVMIFSFLLAFIYGAGAVFIFTWNASIISVAIGNLIRYKLNGLAVSAGLIQLGNYFHIFSIGFLRYLTHGVLEMVAYFIGGLAGGIISVAVIKRDLASEKFNQIVQDSSILFVVSLAVLAVAALIEVYISFSIS
jgi:uncharacterized membrane protein SpoIIM required for sporulation